MRSSFDRSRATSNVPDPSTFEAGDFVWPRPPGRVVIYLETSGEAGSDEEEVESLDKARWERGKELYYAQLPHRHDVTLDQALAASLLVNLSYGEARRLYLGHDTPITPLGGESRFPIYVGHVGIIRMGDDGNPWVVEAVGGSGVRSIRYANWLDHYKARTKVWHGRLKHFSAEQRAVIPQAAMKFDGCPFELWNFDLGDTTNFYCSKLVWVAIRNALNVFVDDNPDTRRWFWFSPKQLMHTKRIELLFSPGPYARPTHRKAAV